MAVENVSLAFIPLEYVRNGRSMTSASSLNATIESYLASISARLMPRHRPPM